MLERDVSNALDKMYGPVEVTFTVTQVPRGGAPREIREDWVGAALPVRKLHAARLFHGYIGRRWFPVPEDRAVDAITGEKPEWPVWGNVEIRGYDAIDSLRELGRISAADYWEPYADAMLGFQMSEGNLGPLRLNR